MLLNRVSTSVDIESSRVPCTCCLHQLSVCMYYKVGAATQRTRGEQVQEARTKRQRESRERKKKGQARQRRRRQETGRKEGEPKHGEHGHAQKTQRHKNTTSGAKSTYVQRSNPGEQTANRGRGSDTGSRAKGRRKPRPGRSQEETGRVWPAPKPRGRTLPPGPGTQHRSWQPPTPPQPDQQEGQPGRPPNPTPSPKH